MPVEAFLMSLSKPFLMSLSNPLGGILRPEKKPHTHPCTQGFPTEQVNHVRRVLVILYRGYLLVGAPGCSNPVFDSKFESLSGGTGASSMAPRAGSISPSKTVSERTLLQALCKTPASKTHHDDNVTGLTCALMAAIVQKAGRLLRGEGPAERGAVREHQQPLACCTILLCAHRQMDGGCEGAAARSGGQGSAQGLSLQARASLERGLHER